MKNIFTLLFILSLFLTISSCKKDAVDVNPNLTGTWGAYHSGYDWELKIYSSNSSYSKISSCYSGVCEYTKYAEGDAKIKNNTLYIGNKKWNISQYPEQETTTGGTQWKMILDGVSYYK